MKKARPPDAYLELLANVGLVALAGVVKTATVGMWSMVEWVPWLLWKVGDSDGVRWMFRASNMALMRWARA